MIEARTPVIVGVAHEVHRPGPPEDVRDAVTLMVAALRAAGADTGAPEVLERLDRIAVVQGLWRWPDPARLLAEAVGAHDARTALAAACGSTPQVLVADAAERIARGEADVVAVCGGEWVNGRAQLRGAGIKPSVTSQTEGRPNEVDEIVPYESTIEVELGFEKPLFIYPLMESAMRHERGESLEEETARCARIISGMSQVAAANPAAWLREAWTPEQVATVTPANPLVAAPYTKRMVSNPKVDMASAIVLTSVATARALDIAEDRWVFPHAAAHLIDRCFFSEFDTLAASPTMALVCSEALARAGAGIDDVTVLDLYSCFPAAVQLEADALGLSIDDDRPLTVSGGMASFGGPIANYVGHVIVDLVKALRTRPGELGLCVANGGYTNRPAAAVYGTQPPDLPYQRADLSDRVSRLPHRPSARAADVTAVIESATAHTVRDTPARGLLTARRDDDRTRLLAFTEDPDLLQRIRTEEVVGRTVTTDAEGRVRSLA